MLNRSMGYNYRYLLIHPWEIILWFGREVKWFCQRGWRGYADCDVWSIDYYLLAWLPDAITVLQCNKIGCPIGLTPKKWQKILKEMVYGLKMAKKIQDLDYDWKNKRPHNKIVKQSEKGLDLFREHFYHLWD